MRVDTEIVASLCRKHAPDLFTPKSWQGTPLDKIRLLWGIAGVESSFGNDCNPRHENGYHYNGRYFDKPSTSAWGCLAHCSYGPWQVMFPNFPVGVSPLSLMWDTDGRVPSEVCLLGAIRVINVAIARGAKSLGDIVLAYNGQEYENHYASLLVACMADPMPESIPGVMA